MEIILGLILLVVVALAGFLVFRRPHKERGGFDIPDLDTAAPPPHDGDSPDRLPDGDSEGTANGSGDSGQPAATVRPSDRPVGSGGPKASESLRGILGRIVGRTSPELRESERDIDDGMAEVDGSETKRRERRGTAGSDGAAPLPPGPPDSTGPPAAPVQFTVFHPQQLLPGDWQKLLAYVHVRSALDAVTTDSERRLQDQTAPTAARSKDQLVEIKRGAQIQIVPQLPGCLFNPPAADVLWLKDWHCGEFEVSASPEQPGYEADAAVNGRVGFFVESVLVGEVPIWALLATDAELPSREPKRTAPVDPFGRIFVSYAHDDGDVVDRLAAAYKVLGMDFLRDVDRLRSGEKWNPRLLEFIDQADVFQLYWSEKARRSKYVEQEWRHALARGQDNFIRPLYWREPLAPPPDELAQLHFDFLPPGK